MFGPDEDDRVQPAPPGPVEGGVWFALMTVGLLFSGFVWGTSFAG